MLTLASFKERADFTTLAELSGDGQVPDDVKLQHALADAWNEIRGYTFRLSAAATPEEGTLESHQFNLAMYKVAGNRQGTESESVAKRYDASIKFLESLTDDKNGLGIVAEATADDPIFDKTELADFGDLGVDE